MFALALLVCRCPGPTPVTSDVGDRIPALVAALKDEDRETRRNAIKTLGKMGTLAADAVPGLIDVMEEDDLGTRTCVVSALLDIGPRAVPHLVRALSSRDASRRIHAAEALDKMGGFHEIGSHAALAITTLTAVAVGDSDKDVRLAAIIAISHIGHKEAVTALLTIAKQDDAEVRFYAAKGLRDLGALAKPAVPAFLELMDEPGMTASVAAQGLVNIGDANAAAGLGKLLCDPTKGNTARCEAAWALGRMPSQSAVAVPFLIRASGVTNAELREYVANGLRELGTDARDAAPALRALMVSDPVSTVRIAAARALYAVRGSDDLAVKCLVTESYNPDYEARAWAAYSLGQVGKKETAAVDALIARLADDNPYVRKQAVSALKVVGRPAAVKAIPALEKLLDDPAPDVRAEVKKALEDLKSN